MYLLYYISFFKIWYIESLVQRRKVGDHFVVVQKEHRDIRNFLVGVQA